MAAGFAMGMTMRGGLTVRAKGVMGQGRMDEGRMDEGRVRQAHDQGRQEQREGRGQHDQAPCRVPYPLVPAHPAHAPRAFPLPRGGLAISPLGGYEILMTEPHRHASHPGLVKRLRRAEGHLRHVIGMIEAVRPCADIAVQLQAVEKAVTAAKRTLIHDHIDHCLGADGETDLEEMKALAKLL